MLILLLILSLTEIEIENDIWERKTISIESDAIIDLVILKQQRSQPDNLVPLCKYFYVH